MLILLDVDSHPVQMVPQTSGTFDTPIFFHPMVKLCKKQRKHQPTLLMTEDVWNYVSDPNVTHEGAFGSDYCIITKANMRERLVDLAMGSTVDPHSVRWVVVWKFPGDLNHLPGHPFRKILDVPLPVGNYPLYDDGWAETKTLQHPSLPKNTMVEKMRTDVPSGNSVHYLEDKHGVKVAMIGSHYFIAELWKAMPEEKRGVVDMISELRSAIGIECFPCFGQHHAIVFYINMRDGTLITPRDLALLLKTTKLLQIMNRYSHMDLKGWASNVVRLTPKATFASALPPQFPSPPSSSGVYKTHYQPHPTGSLLRKRATVDSSYVSQTPVPNNASVRVLQKEGEFVFIRYGTLEGWVRAKYLS